VDFTKQVFNNTALKLGVVVEILDPENEDNISGLGPEYTVMVIEQDGHNGINTSIYKNCLAMDSFGGIADFFQFKRRAPLDKTKVLNDGSVKEQEGSMVLLLCLDGNAEKAVIIGQMQNSSRKTVINEASELHAEGEFNGLRYSVDKDGAFTMVFKGATDEDGVPKDAEVGGTELKIEKDGSIEINDSTLSAKLAKGNRKPKDGKEEEEAAEEEAGGDEIANEKIRLDRTAMTVDIESRKDISLKSDANLNLTSKEKTTITVMDLIVAAEGKAGIETGGPLEIKAGGPFKVEATEAEIKSDGAVKIEGMEVTVKGTSVTIDGTMINLGKGGTPAVTMTTQFLGTGNLGIPVISVAVGPFSSSVFIAS